MMILMLALTATPVVQQERSPLQAQACEMTPTGWVCHYQMPSVTIQGPSSGSVVVTGSPPTPAQTLVPETSTAEADRQARLIARCADASWLSLCLPGDRREARILQEAANARAALSGEVTRLLSENRCNEAVRVALAGGDLALARNARDFCASTAAGSGPAAPQATPAAN